MGGGDGFDKEETERRRDGVLKREEETERNLGTGRRWRLDTCVSVYECVIQGPCVFRYTWSCLEVRGPR